MKQIIIQNTNKNFTNQFFKPLELAQYHYDNCKKTIHYCEIHNLSNKVEYAKELKQYEHDLCQEKTKFANFLLQQLQIHGINTDLIHYWQILDFYYDKVYIEYEEK